MRDAIGEATYCADKIGDNIDLEDSHVGLGLLITVTITRIWDGKGDRENKA